jgi:ribosomal protein S27AE
MPELWRKETHYFIVEIKVGDTWVEAHRTQTLSSAESKAQESLQDVSVDSVKICEHAFTHRCTQLSEESTDNTIHIPNKMEALQRKQDCPRCGTSSTVATDGSTDWVFCSQCDSAFPV